MPTFKLNKLIRDGLKEIYANNGQTAIYKKITSAEHKNYLVSKIIEEASEIPLNATNQEIIDEIADVRQVLEDLMMLCNIDESQVETAKQKIFDKKRGFSEATFIKTLELSDNDPWIEYYRKNPDLFPEKK